LSSVNTFEKIKNFKIVSGSSVGGSSNEAIKSTDLKFKTRLREELSNKSDHDDISSSKSLFANSVSHSYNSFNEFKILGK
jgi:type IV secretory pathway component VirB8